MCSCCPIVRQCRVHIAVECCVVTHSCCSTIVSTNQNHILFIDLEIQSIFNSVCISYVLHQFAWTLISLARPVCVSGVCKSCQTSAGAQSRPSSQWSLFVQHMHLIQIHSLLAVPLQCTVLKTQLASYQWAQLMMPIATILARNCHRFHLNIIVKLFSTDSWRIKWERILLGKNIHFTSGPDLCILLDWDISDRKYPYHLVFVIDHWSMLLGDVMCYCHPLVGCLAVMMSGLCG